MFLIDQMIMMSSLNKTVTHEVRFWCYFTEPVSEVRHIILTPSQPVFVLFLYLILRAKQTFFCLFISVLSLQIQLSRRQRVVIPFFYILPDTCLYQSQARNWISIDIGCDFFFNHLKRDVVVCFVDFGGFYFHHCLIFLSINTNFIVFGLSQKRIKFMIYRT